MRSKFKLTSGELASLSALLIAVTAIAAVLLARSCETRGGLSDAVESCDSITVAVEAARSQHKNATVTKKHKRNRRDSVPKVQRKPLERNYLDEPANE